MHPVAFGVCVRQRLVTGSKGDMLRSDGFVVGPGLGDHLTTALSGKALLGASLLSLDAIQMVPSLSRCGVLP